MANSDNLTLSTTNCLSSVRSDDVYSGNLSYKYSVVRHESSGCPRINSSVTQRRFSMSRSDQGYSESPF